MTQDLQVEKKTRREAPKLLKRIVLGCYCLLSVGLLAYLVLLAVMYFM